MIRVSTKIKATGKIIRLYLNQIMATTMGALIQESDCNGIKKKLRTQIKRRSDTNFKSVLLHEIFSSHWFATVLEIRLVSSFYARVWRIFSFPLKVVEQSVVR